MAPKVYKNLLEKRKGKVIQKRSKQAVAAAAKKKKKKCDEEDGSIKEKMGGRRLATPELLYDSLSKIGEKTELINPKEKTNYGRKEKREHDSEEQWKEEASDEVGSESVDSSKRSDVNGMETSRSNSSTARSHEPDIVAQDQARTIAMQREIIAGLREEVELGREFMERTKIRDELMMKRQEEVSQQIAAMAKEITAIEHFRRQQNRNSNLSNLSRDPNEVDKSGGGGGAGVGGAGV